MTPSDRAHQVAVILLAVIIVACTPGCEKPGELAGNCKPDATCNHERLTCQQVHNGTWNTWKCLPVEKSQ